MELKNNIRKFISANLILLGEEEEIVYDDNDDIFKMGFVNSLFAMKLLNYVENEFEITVDNEDININNFSSINKIIALVNKKKKTLI